MAVTRQLLHAIEVGKGRAFHANLHRSEAATS